MGLENFAVIDERGAIYGPFDTLTGAQVWADAELGERHGYRIAKLNRPIKTGR